MLCTLVAVLVIDSVFPLYSPLGSGNVMASFVVETGERSWEGEY